MARKGTIQQKLLDKLNAVPYYRRNFPKSLGREDIEKYFFKLLNKSGCSVHDQMATCCEHMAVQISDALKPGSRLLVTGGGAYNTFLMERIRFHGKAEVIVPDKLTIDFKEALIFAFLGVLRRRHEVNCLSSVTGASRDSVGGAEYSAF